MDFGGNRSSRVLLNLLNIRSEIWRPSIILSTRVPHNVKTHISSECSPLFPIVPHRFSAAGWETMSKITKPWFKEQKLFGRG